MTNNDDDDNHHVKHKSSIISQIAFGILLFFGIIIFMGILIAADGGKGMI